MSLNFDHPNLPEAGFAAVGAIDYGPSFIMKSWPFFGGEDPPEKTAEGTPDGGVADDPIAQLAADPNKLKDLVKQAGDLSNTLKQVTTERDGLKAEQEKTVRAQQTKEQQQETDLNNANATIEKMDRVIRTVALQNAFINASGETQWNSIKQAMAELDENNYDIQVDLEGGTAEVVNMDKEVARIAKEFSWLVKSAGVLDPANNGVTKPGPGTGRPPAPPRGDVKKAANRAALEKRYPILARGGAQHAAG